MTSNDPCSNSKIFPSPSEAVAGLLTDGITIMSGGFGLSGNPESLIEEIHRVGVRDLTVISNNAGADGFGLWKLLDARQVRKMISSYVGENRLFEQLYLSGELELELSPQGTLAERIRAGGSGIPAFFTRTGVGTVVAEGKQIQSFDGIDYVMERWLRADVAIVKAWKADPEGNLIYRKTARNFNPMMATAGRVTIAEVEEIVAAGELDADCIHTPGIYVDRVVRCTINEKRIEKLTRTQPGGCPVSWTREQMAQRAARELHDGYYVNLGIGIPTLVANFIPDDLRLVLHSENGMLGTGPFPFEGEADPDLINAGKQTVTQLPTSSFFSSADSFAMVRGGHMDLTVLGAMQVAANGDIANWTIPGKMVKGMGGAMDLVAGVRRVVVLMDHVNTSGEHKLVERCTLPLTGVAAVDLVITNLGVFECDRHGGSGLTLIELAPDVTLEEIARKTGAPFSQRFAGGPAPAL